MGLLPDFGQGGPLGQIIGPLLQLLALAVLVRALLSWFIRDPYNPIVQILNAITEPILQPLRQIIPRMGMMDLSPLVAIIVLQVIASMVLSSGI